MNYDMQGTTETIPKLFVMLKSTKVEVKKLSLISFNSLAVLLEVPLLPSALFLKLVVLSTINT